MSDAGLGLLREMASAVARVVKETAPEGFGAEMRMGADGTPTKMVDDLAEREILTLLREKPRDLNLLSEEVGFVDMGGSRLLVADPIDGTTNASRGIPFYCVSLALGTRDLSDVDVGLVMNLPTGDVYEAVRGKGAFLNGRPIRVRPKGEQTVVSVGFPRSDAPPPGIMRSFGASALEMCLVAQGGLDAYHYAKPILRVIDIAAATLIVREAGGVVLDRDGKDLEMALTLAPRFGLTAASTKALAARVSGVPE